jgi:dienelactone hydrolase
MSAPGPLMQPPPRGTGTPRRRQARYLALALLGPVILALPMAIGLDAGAKALNKGSAQTGGQGPVVATSGTIRLTVSDNPSADDQPLTIRVTGLTPGHHVSITAYEDDYRGVQWTGTATFVADRTGTVTNDLASTSGTYTGVNPMGLVSLMTPLDPPPPPSTNAGYDPGRYFFPEGASWQLRIEAKDGAAVVSTSVERQLAPGIDYRRYTLAADGFIGGLYTPTASNAQHNAAVLVLDAGEGASAGAIAARIAANGHPALSVSYFGRPGQPADIDRIPLETFDKPLRILHQLSGADSQHVVVLGSGPSTEAAQLLAAANPDDVHGMVLINPDDIAWHSDKSGSRSSWTLAGRDVPFYAGTGPVDPAAELHPEKTNGPLLFVCGEADPFDGCTTSSDMQARLSHLGFSHEVTDISPFGIGSSVGDLVPYQAHTMAYGGGTLASESLAMPTVWKGVLGWLDGLTAAQAHG